MVTSTSAVAYRKIKSSLADCQTEVLNFLKTIPDATNQEIADALGKQINRITPRTFELREMGEVTFSRVRTCSRTGHVAKAWKVA